MFFVILALMFAVLWQSSKRKNDNKEEVKIKQDPSMVYPDLSDHGAKQSMVSEKLAMAPIKKHTSRAWTTRDIVPTFQIKGIDPNLPFAKTRLPNSRVWQEGLVEVEVRDIEKEHDNTSDNNDEKLKRQRRKSLILVPGNAVLNDMRFGTHYTNKSAIAPNTSFKRPTGTEEGRKASAINPDGASKENSIRSESVVQKNTPTPSQ